MVKGKKKESSPPATEVTKPILIEDLTPKTSAKYRQGHPHAPQHPARVLMTGASGSGKTNALINLILNGVLDFDAIYLYASSADQAVYQVLADFISDLSEELEIQIPFVIESDLDKVIPLNELDKNKQSICIFDDFVTEKQIKQNQIIAPYFVRSRHKNCSVYYLSQSYSLTPVTIRRNCNYFLFFGISRGRDINLIHSDLAGDVDKERFKKRFLEVVKDRYKFFTVDLINPKMKYRKGLSEILTIE